MEMKISEIFKAIAETAGSTAKKELLRVNDNDIIAQIFDYTYGGRKYFVKKYISWNSGDWILDEHWDIVKETLDKLASKEVSGNKAINLLDTVTSRFTPDDQEIIKHIIEGNLKIGLSLKGYQDVNANTVQTSLQKFPCALAINLDKVKGVDVLDGNWLASRKLDGCVSGDTLITMADGSLRTIKDLVESESHEKVLAYNTETKKTEPCKILNHLKNGKDIRETSHQWYEIELEDGRKLKVTGNHRIFIPKLGCYRRVDELDGDEEFLII